MDFLNETLSTVDLAKQYLDFPPKSQEVIKNPEPIKTLSRQLIQELNSATIPGSFKERNWKLVETPDFSDLAKEGGMVVVAKADVLFIGQTRNTSKSYSPAIVVEDLKGYDSVATPWIYLRRVYFDNEDLKKPTGIGDLDSKERVYLASRGFPVGMREKEDTHPRFIMMEVDHLRDLNVIVYGPDSISLQRTVNYQDLNKPGILIQESGTLRLYLGY